MEPHEFRRLHLDSRLQNVQQFDIINYTNQILARAHSDIYKRLASIIKWCQSYILLIRCSRSKYWHINIIVITWYVLNIGSKWKSWHRLISMTYQEITYDIFLNYQIEMEKLSSCVSHILQQAWSLVNFPTNDLSM